STTLTSYATTVLPSILPFFFFFNDPAPSEIYTLSLHDALPISCRAGTRAGCRYRRPASWRIRRRAHARRRCRRPHRPAAGSAVRSEEHTSELQSPYDLVCRLLLEKKKNKVCLQRFSDKY